MKKYEIVGIEITYLCDAQKRLGGFNLLGVAGTVDPFVGGMFMPDDLRVFLDSDNNVISGKEAEFFKAELKWGKEQIGKYLLCDDILYSAFATHGNVAIE